MRLKWCSLGVLAFFGMGLCYALTPGDTNTQTVVSCSSAVCTTTTFNYVWVGPMNGMIGHWKLVSSSSLTYPNPRNAVEK